jgi:ActR/RegA family two-component response regulator
MSVQAKPKSKLILLESDATTAARFTRVASRLYDVVLERDARQAVSLAISDPLVKVFVAGSCGKPQLAVAILEQVRSARADVLRVSLTEPAELGMVIEGLHTGVIERTIQKPIQGDEIVAAITLPSRLATLAAAVPAGGASRRAG